MSGNPFTGPGEWLRANLHAHTTHSDGPEPPAETAARYREAGYDVLAVTDHNLCADVDGLSDGRLLILPGEEMHPTGNRGIRYHLVALGLAGTVEARPLAPQEAVDAARAQGAVVFIAHPTWCGLASADVMELERLAAIEVYNATCLRHGKPSSEALWDELLAAGRLLPPVATDDTHAPGPLFRGDFARAWTMIRARERTPEAVLDALARGRFYATEGPRVEDFRLEPDAGPAPGGHRLGSGAGPSAAPSGASGTPKAPPAPGAASGWRAIARFSPARAVSFLGFAERSRRYELPPGAPDATEWSHPVAEGARTLRLVVEDAAGCRAWTAALPVPGPTSPC